MKAEAKCALSAEFLLQILDAIPVPIFAKDDQARFIFSNARHNQLLDRPHEILIGKSDADFYPAEIAAGFLANDRSVIETGVTSSVEESASLREGMTQSVLTTKVRMAADDGKNYLVGINYSLTEIKKREEQYRALAETVPVGVVQIEEDDSISFCNPLLHAYFARFDGALSLAGLRGLLRQGDTFPGQAARFECDLPGQAGAGRRVLVISSGWLLLSKNKHRSAIVSVVDISENAELKRINEEILRLNRELAGSMKQLKDAQDALVKKGRMEQMGQLTATIAHELRNPLGAVRTSVFLVERKIKDKGLAVESQLQRINNGVTRCDAIITQLLDFSRTKKLECRSDDMDQWLAKIVEEEARRLAACIEVECTLGLDGALVPFDPSRLQRALLNLISNAAEAMVGNGDVPLPSQKEPPRIRIRTRKVGGFVEIEVADNGLGISPEALERVREPLFTTKSFGTGLGLPAVEQIAAQHGGSLDVSSEQGRGACFVVRLPLIGIEQGEAA